MLQNDPKFKKTQNKNYTFGLVELKMTKSHFVFEKLYSVKPKKKSYTTLA